MTRKEKFTSLLKKHGYNSMNAFFTDNHLVYPHWHTRLSNESMKVELQQLFLLANILHEPIEVLIEIFYPEEFKENRSLIEK